MEKILEVTLDGRESLWQQKIEPIEIYNEATPPSVDDTTRTELLWEKREETLLDKWKRDIVVASYGHQRLGKRYHCLYKVFALPTILIPLTLSGLNGITDVNPLVSTILLILSASLQGVVTFVNFGQKYQEHYNYSNLYSELSKEIESELCRPKSKRIACDVFLERVRHQYSHLEHMAPCEK